MEYEMRCGVNVPVLGFGTWQLDTETAFDSVSTALDLGYRHVDTAQVYQNEAGVGGAIHISPVDREEIFLTTKVHPTHRSVEEIVSAVEESVDRLKVERVDLLLIHWPNPFADLGTVMAGLDECVERGLTSHIGVSNFGRNRLDRARELAENPIFTNQVLFHPWWPQRKLLRYCQDHDILLTGYSPLANGGAIDDDVLADIGRTYGKTAPQVALRWATQHENVVTISLSTSRSHQAENIDIFDFLMTQSEHDRITRPSYLRSALAYARGLF